MIYGLKNNYALGVPVSPGDLNRRADVIQAQLPGAFAALGEGVFGPLDLQVNTPTAGKVGAGSALIPNADGVLVYVLVPNALNIPAHGDEEYLHLALRVPSEIGGPTDSAGTDSRRGASPTLLLSDNEEETDALLLAHWNGSTWVDARALSAPARLQVLQTDLGYDAADRAKGTVAQRLDALLGTGEPDAPSGEVTRAEFNALKASLEGQAALINTLLEKLGAAGATTAVDDIDRYLHRDVARLEVEAVRQDAAFSLEIDASVAIPGLVGDGDDLGGGLHARDVHSGTTIWDESAGEER